MISRKRSKTLEIAERSLREGRLEGIIDAPKSGRWGKWEYYMLGKTQCCRRHAERQKSRTTAQGQARDAFGSAAKAWGTKLTPEQRQAWNVSAMEEFSKPRLGQAGPLLGEQIFTRRSSVLLKVGKEMLLWPTARPVFKPNPVLELSVTNGRDGVRIKLQLSGPVEEDIMVLGQAPCSTRRNKWRRGAYLCLFPPPTGGEIDITEKYVARFGEPEPGKKVFIRTQQQRDGWRDMGKDLSEVVPVKAGGGSGETARLGARVALNEANGLNQLHKLQGLQGLHSAGGGRTDAAGTRSGEGKGVRCTRGWFRVATASIPWHYRWETRGKTRNAECGMRIGGATGKRRGRHWRELWHGT